MCHLSPLEGESIAGQLANALDSSNQISRAGGSELHLGVPGEGGQVLEDELLPHLSCLHQSHDANV